MDPIERHLSVKSIKNLLDCSRTKAYEVALECGGVKDGRFLRVPESALKRWMEERRQKGLLEL